MATRKSKKGDRAMLSRDGEITDWRMEIFAHPFNADETTRERRALPSISIFGSFNEAVNGVTKFNIMLTPGTTHIGNAEIPCVGSILRSKLEIEGHVRLSLLEYQTVLAMITTGNLRYFSCEFQTPKYGSALISSMSLDSRKSHN